MLKSEADRLTRVMVCTPGEEYCRVDNLEAHNILEVPDQKEALRQHDDLKARLKAFGAEVMDVAELPDHPNSVFTRDTALCTPNGYIELVPGIDTREAEGGWMAAELDRRGIPRAGGITRPGTVDGGDVVLWGKIAFVGLSGRTNQEGCRQLTGLLESMGYGIRPVPLPGTILHLDKVLMPVTTDRLLVCENIVPAPCLEGLDRIAIDFTGPTNANIICLGNGELIVGRSNRGAAERLDAEGLTVHLLDISEYVKGAGGPNCLIMPVARKD